MPEIRDYDVEVTIFAVVRRRVGGDEVLSLKERQVWKADNHALSGEDPDQVLVEKLCTGVRLSTASFLRRLAGAVRAGGSP